MTTSPGIGTPSRHGRLVAPAVVGAVAVAGAVLLHLRDPHQAGSYGTCPFSAVTGLPCPGCGSLRAVNDLTDGDVVAAAGSNLLAVLLVAALAAAWLVWVVTITTGRPWRLPTPTAAWGWGLLALVVAFGVVRNLPVGAWLMP